MYEIKDKVVLVTGGASGIGASITRAFLEAGAKLVAVLDIKSHEGRALEEEINDIYSYGSNKIKFIHCDITTDDLNKAYDTILEQFGAIDIVVNNAGVVNDHPQYFQKMIAINLTALITSSLRAYSSMRKDKGGNGGTIINISSIAGLLNCSLFPIYSATKAAVQTFTKCLGSDPHYPRSGVRCITVCFGGTDTTIIRSTMQIDEETGKDYQSIVDHISLQSTNLAARGVIKACTSGASASTWLVASGRAAEDITNNITEAQEIMQRGVFIN